MVLRSKNEQTLQEEFKKMKTGGASAFRASPGQLLRTRQLRQQFVVRLVLLARADERFHGFNRVEVHHHAAQLAHRLDVPALEQLLFLAGAAARDVQRREQATVG